MPVVRTDDRSVARAVYGHVKPNCRRMGRFTELWSSKRARLELCYERTKTLTALVTLTVIYIKKNAAVCISQPNFVSWFLNHDNKVS